MLQGGQGWAPRASAIQRLRRNDHSMIWWICGTHFQDEVSTVDLHAKLGVAGVANELCARMVIDKGPTNT